jgi:hypothetical protein
MDNDGYLIVTVGGCNRLELVRNMHQLCIQWFLISVGILVWYYMMWYDMIYLLTAVVQYTFSHKKYTEQRNETEYPERNIRKIRILNLQN